MFGSLSCRVAQTAIRIAFAMSVLLSAQAQAQAQAQSIVGTWTMQGSDFVLFLDSNGREVWIGTNMDFGCSGVNSQSGSYTASAGTLTHLYDTKYGCNGILYPRTSNTGTATYVLSGDTLTITKTKASSDGTVDTFTVTRVPAQTRNVVGTWNAQGMDWVWNFQTDGQFVVTGTGAAPHCQSASTAHGTYTASAGVLSFSMDSWTCDGTSFAGVNTGLGRYAFTGNTLTAYIEKTSGTNVGDTFGFILNLQGGTTTTTTIAPTTPLPPPPVVQSVYTAPSGQMPEAAVEVTATGTFGNASLSVSLDVVKVLQALPAAGFAASTYNVYVAALVPAAVIGAASPAVYVKSRALGWSPLKSPLAAYLEDVTQGAADNKVLIEILSNNDISSLVGTEIYIGYGTSEAEMVAANRYRGIYKAQ
jgi:hypothetical protein